MTQKSLWQKYRGSSRSERRTFQQALALLPLAHLALAGLGYARLMRLMEKAAPRPTAGWQDPAGDATAEARVAGRAVSRAARRGIFKASCLRRALVVWWLLRRRGLPAEMCFGVRRSGGQLEAHAWVTVGGEVVSEEDGTHLGYQALGSTMPVVRTGL